MLFFVYNIDDLLIHTYIYMICIYLGLMANIYDGIQRPLKVRLFNQ